MSATAPFDPNLLDALEASAVAQVEGIVWRQILDPTSVMRPNQRGGRWNRPGTEALYCSLTPATATAEIDHLVASQPVPITRQRRTFGLAVRLSRVIDLRAEPWAQSFTYPYDATDIDQCQAIGSAVAWLECSGMIVPSQRHEGDNLVIFVANLDHDDSLEPMPDGHPHPPGPPTDVEWAPLESVTTPQPPP
jgi:RES domain-containing protein